MDSSASRRGFLGALVGAVWFWRRPPAAGQTPAPVPVPVPPVRVPHPDSYQLAGGTCTTLVYNAYVGGPPRVTTYGYACALERDVAAPPVTEPPAPNDQADKPRKEPAAPAAPPRPTMVVGSRRGPGCVGA